MSIRTIDDILDERQLNEVKLATYYTEGSNHGTDGHNRLNLIYILYLHCKSLEGLLELLED